MFIFIIIIQSLLLGIVTSAFMLGFVYLGGRVQKFMDELKKLN